METRYETYAFWVPASSFCGLPTNVSRRPSLKSSAIARVSRPDRDFCIVCESSAISDQSSECSEASSAQITSKFAGSWVELGVGGGEAGAGDVWIAELELALAPRHNEADSYKGSCCVGSCWPEFIMKSGTMVCKSGSVVHSSAL